MVFRNHAIFWSKVYSVWFERFLHIVSCAIVEEVDYSDISFGDFSFLEVIWGSTLTRSPYSTSPSPRPLWWLFISGGYMGQHIDSPPLCTITIWRLVWFIAITPLFNYFTTNIIITAMQLIIHSIPKCSLFSRLSPLFCLLSSFYHRWDIIGLW